MTITYEKLDEIERGLEGLADWEYSENHEGWLLREKDGAAFLGYSETGLMMLPRPSIRDHITRMKPATVKELIRLARIGLKAEAVSNEPI